MYGKTIKSIRVNKGLPLKSVYFGVCSKTNAIKFEKDERILTVDKFIKVINNLMISMAEFQWIMNDYKPESKYYYNYKLSKLWNSNKTKDFKDSIKKLERNSLSIERVELASYKLLNSYQENKNIDEKELKIVINYFSSLSSWTLEDIKFFANNCYVLPYTLMLNLLKESLKVLNKYKYYPNSDNVFATLLVNCIERMISEKDFKIANTFIELLDKITLDITMNGFYLLSKYFSAKIVYLSVDKIEGKNMLLKVLKIAEFLRDGKISSEIEQLLQ